MPQSSYVYAVARIRAVEKGLIGRDKMHRMAEGSLEEVMILCSLDERILPTIDFGHLNARELGRFYTPEDYEAVLDHLTDGSLGGATFWEIRDAMLVHNDEFFVLKDFAPYMAAWEKLAGEVGSETFAKKSLTNIARAGIFSSDRTVREYADEIWHLTY